MIETRPLTPAEHSARNGSHRPVRGTPPSIAEHMAGHMLDIAAVNGEACLDRDLLLRGFTLGELRHHGAEANLIAITRSGGGLC
jgi:hypothetical protein